MSEEKFRMDKRFFSIVGFHDPPDETAFWLSKTPQERLEAVEYMRRMNYGDAACGRLQRIFEITQRKKS